MTEVYICDAIRTPVGRYGGGLAPVRADDLAALPIRALLERNPDLDPAAVDDVIPLARRQVAALDADDIAALTAWFSAPDHGDEGDAA